jgi:hypothetical protein
MGTYWYARSRELDEVEQRMDEVERRIVRAGADPRALDAALDEREALFRREEEVRAELARRGRAVTLASARAWPPHVAAHVAALRPAQPDRPILDVVGWETHYYVENLRAVGVPMRAFAQPLDYLRASPEQAREVAGQLLAHAARASAAAVRDRTRDAGLWLYVWGSVDCSVAAGT